MASVWKLHATRSPRNLCRQHLSLSRHSTRRYRSTSLERIDASRKLGAMRHGPIAVVLMMMRPMMVVFVLVVMLLGRLGRMHVLGEGGPEGAVGAVGVPEAVFMLVVVGVMFMMVVLMVVGLMVVFWVVMLMMAWPVLTVMMVVVVMVLQSKTWSETPGCSMIWVVVAVVGICLRWLQARGSRVLGRN
jgi:hypothetical protein